MGQPAKSLYASIRGETPAHVHTNARRLNSVRPSVFVPLNEKREKKNKKLEAAQLCRCACWWRCALRLGHQSRFLAPVFNYNNNTNRQTGSRKLPCSNCRRNRFRSGSFSYLGFFSRCPNTIWFCSDWAKTMNSFSTSSVCSVHSSSLGLA